MADRRKGRALVALAALAFVTLASCGVEGSTEPTGGSGVTGQVIVFAAASLTESFTEIGREFEAANPGSKVTFVFAGSSTLATQINQGAPADVFAAASPATMKTVIDARNGDGIAVVFARNQLVIAVPKGNPRGIAELSDLNNPEVKVALCAEQVPCGAAAKKALGATGAALIPVTLEQDVKAALSKVRLGEVDAALVYRTDAKTAASDVDGIEFAESADAMNDYPIVAIKDAPNKAGAAAFLAFVQSGKAMAALAQAGFQTP